MPNVLYSEPLDESLLQVDHRIPYEIGGEQNEEDIDMYMLLSPSANRAKSWTCEHCANRTEKRSLHSNTIGFANTEKGQVLPANAILSSPADGPVAALQLLHRLPMGLLQPCKTFIACRWTGRRLATASSPAEVPCEADASRQGEFMQGLSSLLKEKDETTVVYYADGVHPTHDSRSTYAWIEKGEELSRPTVSVRERVNINGLLNAYDVTDVTAHDCESVNAQSTKALYGAALEKHPEASKTYIISDNAGYYRDKELQEWVKGTKTTPLFLPPYPPDLNLMERLWKFLRKKVTNTGFYRTKGEFRKAIRDFFDRTGGYKEELEKLLTLNFRLINS